MRRSLLKPFSAALVLLSAGCAATRPKTLDAGAVDKGVYRNEFFGFVLPVPPGAQISGKAESEDLKKEGVKAVLDPKLAKQAETSMTVLLTFYVKSSARHAGDNLAVTLGAEKIPAEDGNVDAEDYVAAAVKMVKDGPAKGETAGPGYFVRLGGQEFAAQDLTLGMAGDRIPETLHVVLKNGYALILTTTYGSAAGRKRAHDIVAALQFDSAKPAPWYETSAGLDRRWKELEAAWSEPRKPGGVAADKMARANLARAPEWTRLKAWREEVDGKLYAYGVGTMKGVRDPALMIDAAEAKGRASIAGLSAKTTVEEKTDADGSVTRTTIASSDAVLKNAAPVDWYRDGGAFYCLVVEPP